MQHTPSEHWWEFWCVIINTKEHRRFYFAVNLWQHKSTEANANVGEMYPEKYWCYKQHTQLTKMVTGAAIKSGMD